MISGVKWKASPPSGGNTDERSYKFTYDKLYRLTAATYKAKTGSTWTKDVNGFDESVTYDWNGNIATLLRKSVISSSVTTIDNLTYDYGSNNDNNQLLNMTESGSNSYGYRNFTSSSSGYSYDENGNLTADAKKGTTLTYNEQNKVLKIRQDASPNKYLEYAYDAGGSKLSKTIYDGSSSTTINYIGGFEFDNSNALTSFAMPEGRVRKTGSSTFTFEYFITDHQGNVRVSFEDNSGSAIVRQENSYYPYGMIMAGNYQPSAPNNNLYNAGSRWQDDFSGIVDYFSTFFREYDPVLGRFNSVDPKAEATVELSVYHYAGNNPINFNDPMGDVKSAEQMVDIINRLLESPYGGYWSSTNENSLFMFGDEESRDVIGFYTMGEGAGGGYGGNEFNPIERVLKAIWNKTSMGYKVTAFTFGYRLNEKEWGATVLFNTGDNNEIIDTDLGEIIEGFAMGSHFIGMCEHAQSMEKSFEYFSSIRENANTSLGLTDLTILTPLERAFKYGEKIATGPEFFTKGATYMKSASRIAGGLVAFIDVYDAMKDPRGIQTKHVITVAADIVSIINPVFGTIWFVGDLISRATTGKSLGENLSLIWSYSKPIGPILINW